MTIHDVAAALAVVFLITFAMVCVWRAAANRSGVKMPTTPIESTCCTVEDCMNFTCDCNDVVVSVDELKLVRECMNDKLSSQLAAERKLLYRIGRRMMESQATGEPLNLDLLRSEIDAILYPPKTPEKHVAETRRIVARLDELLLKQ